MNEFIISVMPFAITGAIVSAIIQATKVLFKKSGNKLLLAIGVSIVGGIILQFTSLVPSEWYTTVIAVFAAANTIYVSVVKLLEA